MSALFPLALALAVTTTAGAAPNKPAVVALIIANNVSHKAGRSTLQYADDDGAKYYDVFSTVASPDDVVLLTSLDRDTERIFPHLADRALAPSHANFEDAARVIAAKVDGYRAAHREVDFFFVF